MKPHQLAINTVSLRGEIEAIVKASAEAGFVNIEFALGQVQHYLHAGRTPAEFAALLSGNGLSCIGGFAGGMTPLATGPERRANIDFHVANARLLSELGGGAAQMMVVGTDGPPLAEWPDPLNTAAAMLAEIALETSPLNVHVLLEFNWGSIKSVAAAAEIVRLSGAANAGVLFDPAHYYCTPSKLDQLTEANIATIQHVHVDNMRPIPPELSNCNSDRVLPDDPSGVLNLKELFGRLESGGYAGNFSIEMFSDQLWGMAPEAAAKRMYESMQALLD